MAANDPLQAGALGRREDHLPQHAAAPDGPGRRTRETGATTRGKVLGLYGTAYEGAANRAPVTREPLFASLSHSPFRRGARRPAATLLA